MPTGQTSGQIRCTALALPAVSSQVRVAFLVVLPAVQPRGMFCAVVVVPTKLRFTALAPEKFAALAPVKAQLLTVVVAAVPLLSPPDGVTEMLLLPLEPTVVTPVKLMLLPGLGA